MSRIESAHPGRLAQPNISGLTPYVPGKPISELQRELGLSGIVKLASNENAWGASPRAIAAMHAALDEVALYPDGSGHELKQALAAHLKVDAACLTLGAGSNELLALLAEGFLTPDCNAVYSQYAFAIYPLITRATGARAIEVPALDARAAMPLGHDLDAMQRAVGPATRLVFIANPNNPTGTWLNTARLREFIEQAPAHTLVALDEAYLEFGVASGCEDAIGWVQQWPNLVLFRTFSKAYGLAGVRVGYSVSHPEVADVLNRIRPAFNVTSAGLAGARAALGDQAHVRECVRLTLSGREQLQSGCRALGLRTIPSAGNFLLVHFGATAQKIYNELLKGGYIVRPVTGYGLPEYLRITVGTAAQNDGLLTLLAACLQRGA
jgi:histidinol-phosphate aminotransferase